MFSWATEIASWLDLATLVTLLEKKFHSNFWGSIKDRNPASYTVFVIILSFTQLDKNGDDLFHHKTFGKMFKAILKCHFQQVVQG